jgi:hypothetical protein
MAHLPAIWLMGFMGVAGLAVAGTAEWVFALQDRLNHAWTNELVHYDLLCKSGEFWPGGVRLIDGAGQAVPVQLTDVSSHPDGSVAKAAVWFIATVPPNGEVRYTLKGGAKGDKPAICHTDLTLKKKGERAELTTSRAGVRVLLGAEEFKSPAKAEKIPAPLQALRLCSGAWTGRGWFETKHLCTRYKAGIVEDGPVFKRIDIRYDFAAPAGWGRQETPFYEMTVRVAAGQEIATITETYNLGDPKVSQEPKFKNADDELVWDWWGGRPVGSPDNFCFSLCEPFKPTHARTIAPGVSPEKRGKTPGPENEYELPFTADRFEFAITPLVGCNIDHACAYTVYRKEQPDSDVVSILATMAGRWRNPDILPHEPSFIHQHTDTASMRVHTSAKPDLVLRAPLSLGHREWAIATLRNPGVVTAATDLTVIGQLSRKYGALPLDKVKDWVLDWPQKAKYPRLFITPGDITGLRARIKSIPVLEQGLRKVGWSIDRWALDGNEKDCSDAFPGLFQGGLVPKMYMALRWPVVGERTGYNQFPKEMMDYVYHQADVMLAWEKMPAEQRQEFLRCLAFLEYLLWDREYLPPRKAGFAMAGDDLWLNIQATRALLAALLADHPMAETWVKDSANYFSAHMRKWYGEDGSPFAVPGFMPAPWGGPMDGFPLVPVLLALDRTGLVGDAKDLYPNYHKHARFTVDMLPPKDIRFGQRILPTIGVVGWKGSGIAGEIAALFRKSDPDLAAELMWTWQTSGPVINFLLSGLWFDHTGISPKPANLGSVAYPGYGAFLRSGSGTAEESYLAVRFGAFTAQNTHNDAGSVHWYARGVPLSMDWATAHKPETKEPWWHNALSYNHREPDPPTPCPGKGHKDCFYTGKPWYEHKFEPTTALAPMNDPSAALLSDSNPELHGRMAAFASQPGADYVRGEAERRWFETRPYTLDRQAPSPTPAAPGTQFPVQELRTPFRWTRQFAFVKDKTPAGPNYLVIADDLTGNADLEPAFNFWCMAKEVSTTGANEHHFAGQFGVDLDLFVLEPREGRTRLGEWGHRQGPSDLAKDGMEETQRLVRIFGQPGGKGFLVVLYPRKPDEPKPNVEVLADGRLVKLSLPDQTHWIVLNKDPLSVADGEVKLSGTAGVIKQWKDGRSEVTLLAAGQVECAGLALQSKKPATKVK